MATWFVSTGQPAVAVALVELNGDGTLDLVTANSEVADSNRLAAGTVSAFVGAGEHSAAGTTTGSAAAPTGS